MTRNASKQLHTTTSVLFQRPRNHWMICWMVEPTFVSGSKESEVDMRAIFPLLLCPPEDLRFAILESWQNGSKSKWHTLTTLELVRLRM